MKRAALLVLVLVAGLSFSVGTAEAQSDDVKDGGIAQTADVKGGTATCTPDQNLSYLTCDITDSAADKNGIYVAWESTGETGQFRNEQGSGHTEHWETDVVRGIDTSTLRWKVCRDEALDGDDCSDWKMHAVGPNGSSIELQCQLDGSNSTCYLPDNGLGSDPPSANCLYTIATTAAGLTGAKSKAAAKVSARFIPGVGWAVTVIGAGQGIAQCT